MFRTEIKIPLSSYKIDHSTQILTMGSCFADVIGNKFSNHKFPTLVNPFGTVFNPVSLFNLLNLSLEDKPTINSIYHNEKWFSFDFHSDFAENSNEELTKKIKKELKKVRDFINQANVISLTLGTAFVYRESSTNQIVANCHKLPASNFTKELLPVEEIIKSFEEIFQKILSLNPTVQFILTVSPVRHLRDTIRLNTISKSILQLACHAITEKYNNVTYFPAFEIMVDDLRDYRFYKEDMIHPSELAEKYIWNKFQSTYFAPSTIQLNERWMELKKAIDHKPFSVDTKNYKDFIRDTIEKLRLLNQEISVENEIRQMQKRLD